MIYVTGDMHGEFSRFKNKNIKKQLEENDTLIICGDFGFIWEDSRHERSIIEKIGELNYNVAFVDGCHETLIYYSNSRLLNGTEERLTI